MMPLNPCLSTSIRYLPGISAGSIKTPLLFVVVEDLTPVSVLIAVIWAPAITAFEGSSTTPVSAALVDWPKKEQGNTRQMVNNRDRQTLMTSSWKLHMCSAVR